MAPVGDAVFGSVSGQYSYQYFELTQITEDS
jgi:hypothetical protein